MVEDRKPLSGIVALEIGGREAVGICGNLLAHLGATVLMVEPQDKNCIRSHQRVVYASGKHSLCVDYEHESDANLVGQLMSTSDVVLCSSDVDRPVISLSDVGNAVLCDITAFGATGPLAGRAFSEFQMQAMCGFMDTTGPSDGPPVPIAPPMVSYFTGSRAAAGIIAALRVRRRSGLGQRVEVAMYDCAFMSLNAFLAGILTGKIQNRGRVGNRHPTTPAWNMFDTLDGKVMICAGSQSQWLRLCDLMRRPDLVEQYPTAQARMQALNEIDSVIGAWAGRMTCEDCVNKLSAAGVAAGPVAPLKEFPQEANLAFRKMVKSFVDNERGTRLHVPGSPISIRGTPLGAPLRLPAPDEDHQLILDLVDGQPAARHEIVGKAGLPLQGLRVIEVGQYTTAPMCARDLALLGADVIKIEKPGGDESRSFPPRKGERSEVYSMMNGNKYSIVLDLQQSEDMSRLRTLLRDADVLLENNKPGTLDRYGLSAAEIAQDFPHLVHCAISAFGVDSLYADRPGFDTVIQAMAGFMTAVNPKGEPFKSGVSASDLMGSQIGQVAILAALEQRDATGRGMFIDLSMQDISCWLSATLWNGGMKAFVPPELISCSDGFVVVDASRTAIDQALKAAGLFVSELAVVSRQEAVDRLLALGLAAASVNTIKEVALHPQTKARNLWWLIEEDGESWPVVPSPLHLSLTQPLSPGRAPNLDENRAAVLALTK